jgi:hypothetical protein
LLFSQTKEFFIFFVSPLLCIYIPLSDGNTDKIALAEETLLLSLNEYRYLKLL